MSIPLAQITFVNIEYETVQRNEQGGEGVLGYYKNITVVG